jgi:hypothetical protein
VVGLWFLVPPTGVRIPNPEPIIINTKAGSMPVILLGKIGCNVLPKSESQASPNKFGQQKNQASSIYN